MKGIILNTYRVLRSIVVTGLVSLIAIFVIAYLVLVIPRVQKSIKNVAEKELTSLLKTNVSIGSLSISPFNQVVLYNVCVPDQANDTLLNVEKLGAGISLYNLVAKQKLVFTYAEIVGINAHITKKDPQSQTNLQFIIDALSPKDKKTPPKQYDVKIYNIVIRKSSIAYDVLSEPHNSSGFDKNHIQISKFRSDIVLPRIKNDDYLIDVKRLSLKEKSGFELTDFTTKAEITNKRISISQFRIELPNSLIDPDDFTISFNDLKTLGTEYKNIPFEFNIANSYITLSDLACFVPGFNKFNSPIKITTSLNGKINDLNIPVLSIKADEDLLSLDISGKINYILDKNNTYFRLPHIAVKAHADEIAKITSNFAHLSNDANRILSNCGNVSLDGSMKGGLRKLYFNGLLATSLGNLDINGDFYNPKDKEYKGFNGSLKTKGLKVGKLLNKENLLDEAAFDIELAARIIKGKLNGKIDGEFNYIDFKGYRYNDIVANVDIMPSKYAGIISIDDDNIKLKMDGVATLAGKDSHFDVTMTAGDVNFANLNLLAKYPNHSLNVFVDAEFTGNNIQNANGSIAIHDLAFIDTEGNGVKLDNLDIIADKNQMPNRIELNSDIINGSVVGVYNFNGIVRSVKEILAPIFPTLISKNDNKKAIKGESNNKFEYAFRLDNNDKITEILNFFKSPIEVLYPITLSGHVDDENNTFSLLLDAPYLAQKNKLIEGSKLEAYINPTEHNLVINAQTTMPTKNGKMDLLLTGNGVNDCADMNVSWKINRDEDYHGDVNFSAKLLRSEEDNSLGTVIDINPTKLVFNDTAWQIMPSKVCLNKDGVKVDNFKVSYGSQFITIDGNASKDMDDMLTVELNDINLDYVFQSLAINNVQFGGNATGIFYASDIMSKMPLLFTPNLHVDGLKYNNAVLGDADISSRWNNEDKSVSINAKLSQSNGCSSSIDGAIYPTKDSLFFEFNAQKINIEFMKPFMSAFTSDIQGEASGYACLYGTFHDIDLKGDIFADYLKMKVDYTNVYYTTTDSIKIKPGIISFKNVVLKDRNGKTANLSGWVRHKYFHDASFKFSITDAHDFLCYDVTPKQSQNWYGTIYGNGSAFINGEPGVVNITANMSTADNSKFTFVLSDSEAATDYNFITFRDRDKLNRVEAELDEKDKIRQRFEKRNEDNENIGSTKVNINLLGDVTPQAQMTLVMDPIGGDKIRATGQGNLKMVYNSADDKLEMYGKYVLQKGYYNFTLQDIIIKDFTIKEGSSISFDGDPLAAKINIEAVYGLNANLRDLDESFAVDKDMNRTNVPVHALLNVDGDIKEPAISFDLEFPTLTSDAYRKVKSIISTDDMMNRQIIYLLALNRFYTPDYMGSVNKNNELASVASSTISSQLSSILGQISENWNISPNFRTDKGDFSDVEVDLALSSQLLNNRLLFNGNFGYRDNAMNTRNSNFIGDFDLEYLLNKNGNIRLKAYNRYNDQNYYVKSALTTQGVGIVFKYDFENPFGPKLKLNKPLVTDSVRPNRQDSVQLIKSE